MLGIVARYNPLRGYGFIDCEGGRFFFHKINLFEDVAPGDLVEFWLDDDRRQVGKLKAVDIRKICSETLTSLD